MFINQPELIPIAFLCTITIIILTMAIFLYIKLKSQIYLILSGVFLISTITHVLFILENIIKGEIDPYKILYVLLFSLSYVVVQMGIYHLFNPKDFKKLIIFIAASSSIILLGILSFFVNKTVLMVLVSLITLGVTGYSLYWPNAKTMRKRIYMSASSVYAAVIILAIVSLFYYTPGVVFISMSLNLLFYFLIFLVFFERIVDLMQAVSYSSITDGLTRLYNRRYFSNQVKNYVSNQVPVSVIFFDLDNFKKLNDTQGHHIGDEVLKQVAKILQEEVEGIGLAGRYGGEEMVILITDKDVSVANVAERIRARVEKNTIVTVSVGFSRYSNDITAHELIAEADEAMYEAKTTGKNKVVVLKKEGENCVS